MSVWFKRVPQCVQIVAPMSSCSQASDVPHSAHIRAAIVVVEDEQDDSEVERATSLSRVTDFLTIIHLPSIQGSVLAGGHLQALRSIPQYLPLTARRKSRGNSTCACL